MRNGHQEFSHFWFYPLIATPAAFVSNAIGAHPIVAFVLTNALLLGIALWAATRVFGPLAALFIIASPVVWFVGRAQVEIFTVSLLTLAMAAVARYQWGWASIALAIASTQNAPIAAALPLVWCAAGCDWILCRRRARLALRPEALIAHGQIGFALVAVAISLFHPVYYLDRLGALTPQQLNGGIAREFPSLDRYLTPILDPDIGFLAWMPLLAVLGAIGIALALRSASDSVEKTRTLVPHFLGLTVAAWFLCVFAQTTNVNSGGTVHVSRYALWMIPLLLPAVGSATRFLLEQAPAQTLLAAIGVFALYLGYFHPNQAERYVEHSPQATWMQTNLPDLYRPLPEVFVERTLHIDGGPRASAVDPACRVILIVESSPDQPCALTSHEDTQISRIFAGDQRAAWIRRAGVGASTVTPAPVPP